MGISSKLYYSGLLHEMFLKNDVKKIKTQLVRFSLYSTFGHQNSSYDGFVRLSRKILSFPEGLKPTWFHVMRSGEASLPPTSTIFAQLYTLNLVIISQLKLFFSLGNSIPCQ